MPVRVLSLAHNVVVDDCCAPAVPDDLLASQGLCRDLTRGADGTSRRGCGRHVSFHQRFSRLTEAAVAGIRAREQPALATRTDSGHTCSNAHAVHSGPRSDALGHMDSENDALNSLRLGEVALRAVLEGLPDATVGATRDGTIVFVNALAESQFGYRREELIGRPIKLLWPERVRDRYRRNMELYFTVEHPLSFTERAYGLRRDGSEFEAQHCVGVARGCPRPAGRA